MAAAAATPRNVRDQSDISVMKTEEDGSFKRKAASFRNTIEKGGKFEPESGESLSCYEIRSKYLTYGLLQTDIISTSLMPVVSDIK